MLILLLLFAQAAVPSTSAAALFQAINQHSSSSRAEALIKGGADPNARDGHLRTPLHAAVRVEGLGKQELIRLLLVKGADPNTRDEYGAAPLDEAAWQGWIEKAALLIGGGAEIDAPETKTGATPLNEAAFNGHLDLMKLLLAHGADANKRDSAGFKPIDTAVRRHHPEVVEYLLSIAKDRGLATSLVMEAVRRGQADTLQVLLAAGANVNSRSATGSTALYEAALKGDNEIVALLVSRGANLNARELSDGSTPLYAAAAFGREQAVATLLLWGADPNLLTNEGVSPLNAAMSNQFAAVAALIRTAGGR